MGRRSTGRSSATATWGFIVTGSIRHCPLSKPLPSPRTASSSPRQLCATVTRRRTRAGPARCSARALPISWEPAARLSAPSPFDYGDLTRVLVVTDVARDDPDQIAAAFRALFAAARGGGLGLFTAISRLRQTYERLAPALESENLPLYAQHVDAMDTTTLVDVFRAEHDACLLGTDALRDGIDVPGPSLRLIVFDRVTLATPGCPASSPPRSLWRRALRRCARAAAPEAGLRQAGAAQGRPGLFRAARFAHAFAAGQRLPLLGRDRARGHPRGGAHRGRDDASRLIRHIGSRY